MPRFRARIVTASILCAICGCGLCEICVEKEIIVRPPLLERLGWNKLNEKNEEKSDEEEGTNDCCERPPAVSLVEGVEFNDPPMEGET